MTSDSGFPGRIHFSAIRPHTQERAFDGLQFADVLVFDPSPSVLVLDSMFYDGDISLEEIFANISSH